MTAHRLYKVVMDRDDEDLNSTLGSREPGVDPAGWAEFCQEKWGEYRSFFWPSTRRIYQSRSAALQRMREIDRWGGSATVVECTPEWETIEDAKRERAVAQQHKRVIAIRLELNRAQYALNQLMEGADE